MIYRNGIMKKIISILVAAMAAAAVCQAQEISPNAIVKDLSGSSVLMGDVLKNDVVIVSFWATWCKPCQAELDALAEIEDMWADQIRVVAISTDDARSASKVKSTVKAKMWPYEVYTDENSTLAKSLNISTIPFVMIVSGGKTVYSHTGYTPGSERLLVDKALSFLE
jgi:thiol-disulfide isomerase/thioredoxin